MSDLQPERQAIVARIKEFLEPVNDLAVFAHAHGNSYQGPNIAEQLTDFILADRQAQRTRIYGEMRTALPRERRTIGVMNQLERIERFGFNQALSECRAVIEEVERNG